MTVGGHAGTDVAATPTSLTFATANWDMARTVTVTAGNDADTANDSVTLTHTAASTDSGYSGIAIGSVAVTVQDHDTNAAPTFDEDATATRSFAETVGDAAVATASDIGAGVTATDVDNDTLTYSLEGTDASKFTVVSTSGQIRTKVGESYDRETKASYAVTATAAPTPSPSPSTSPTRPRRRWLRRRRR